MGYKVLHKRKKSEPGGSPSSCGESVHSDSSDSDSSLGSTKSRLRLRKNGSIELVSNRDGIFETQGASSKETKILVGQNPWGLRCHREQLAKMKMNSRGSSNVQKFILLENIASKFMKPCILDLKMGTRQHGDDATKEKRELQIEKCASTTSRTLGMRICGMQVYQANTSKYICHNKFYGRQLEEDGFENALYQFFHNGIEFQGHLLEPLLKRIQSLHKVLSRQNTFRYYSSSLLLIYDGMNSLDVDNMYSDDDQQCARQCDDNAQHHDNNERNDKHKTDKTSFRNSSLESTSSSSSSSSLSKQKNGKHCQQQHNASSRRRSSKLSSATVDVRMIDFAHTTHQGFTGDHKVHDGPDRGYLFGLENLMGMLRKLIIENCYNERSIQGQSEHLT